MAQKSFYMDSCIWLNLFKKEGDPTKGVPYWKIAKDFIETVEESDDLIIISPMVLKELSFKLGDKYSLAKEFFDKTKNISIIKSDSEDFTLARKLESEFNYEIGFFDCLHIAISKRLNLNLVTRDKDLLRFANKYVSSNKPEELY